MNAPIEPIPDSATLFAANAPFIEDLYDRYLADPGSVSPEWRNRFDALRPPPDEDTPGERPHRPVREQLRREAGVAESLVSLRERLAHEDSDQPTHDDHLLPEDDCGCSGQPLSTLGARKQAAVLRLINGYRYRGHQIAALDPIALRDTPRIDDLDPAYHGLSKADFTQVFNTGSLHASDCLPLREILALLRQTYCNTVGAEYMHITSTREKRWIQRHLEGQRAQENLSNDDRRWLLKLLTAAEGFEKYLHKRYVGQKRFSLEGSDALIPLLDDLIQRAGSSGHGQVVIGMAHRGRLNVLTNIFGKPPQDIFDEFEDNIELDWQQKVGDVKYHMGFASQIETPGGTVHAVLGFNPSHLEVIDAVIEGSVRARQRRLGDRTGGQVLPVLIHGDAAFAGQGVVMETLQLSQTRSYATGGTVHIVVNNQIGFTTSHPLDVRSSDYCTDVAKIIQAPVLHVNGDDPEAVIFVTRLALDYRNRFNRDVVIDLICYRRLGHNEADEPAVTQPIMYHKIRNHPTPRAVYAQRLIDAGLLTKQDTKAMVKAYHESIEEGCLLTRPVLTGVENRYHTDWRFCTGTHWDQDVDTGVPAERLRELSALVLHLPEGFDLHPRVEKIWTERAKMANGELMFNWGGAEILAYASLLDAGTPVRLSGQDAGRGTFFHRHAKIHDQQTGETRTPLQHLHADQGAFIAIDSILSEEAVLGYEYGFATAEPHALTIWEAQFGDFANGAQVIIDQFITSAGAKWGLHCGLVMLLPHGLEGQGAEHSSARLERYLQLCAKENIQVCVPTTPAQIFHLLRRQIVRHYRTPLIVMTPKSLLRHRLAVSALEELATGRYQVMMPEIDDIDPASVERLIFCSGKVFYDLLEARRTRDLRNCAIVRIEQIHPFPHTRFMQEIERYSNAVEIVWCQEEAQNQGAWSYLKDHFYQLIPLGKRPYYAGRPASAAPAVGHRSAHIEQQERLIDEALSGEYNAQMNYRITPK